MARPKRCCSAQIFHLSQSNLVRWGSLHLALSSGVIDFDGSELPPNKEGDIAVRVKPVRPIWMFKEYWRDPDASAACIRGDWYITGDRAYKDEDGYFWFVGRADDVINSAGYRIGPFEVESALKEHPAVAESAVIASPDAMRGEVVKAYVILAPGYTASPALATELQEHVKRVTAPYKYPREIQFVDALPKTISGKIRAGSRGRRSGRRNKGCRPLIPYKGARRFIQRLRGDARSLIMI